jgi:putative transposase
MRKSRFTDDKVNGILRKLEASVTAKEACRKHGISELTLYGWKAKHGGMEANESRRLRNLEDANRRLKRMLDDLSLDNQTLK